VPLKLTCSGAGPLVGVAVANFFPRLGLTALYGGQSTMLENVVKGPGSIWAIAAQLTGPIFQGGALIESYKQQQALVEQLEKRKMAATTHPRRYAGQASRTRHVPAAVKRAAWTRDQGRCAFVGAHGRCQETAFVEFHHVRPFAVGGVTDVDNLELRCRAHNAYEATCFFGEDPLAEPEEARG